MIRVLLVDDDPFIRESLKLIFDMNPLLEVAGTCHHGREAHEFLLHNGPVDVVLMDIRMPDCDGVEGTKLVKTSFPQTAVLILTTFDDDEYIVEAIQNGANGYLLKNIPPDRIIEGIRTVHQGDLLIHPNVAKKLAGLLQPRQQPQAAAGHPGGKSIDDYNLTPSEKQIMTKIAEGKSNKEIAQELFLSEGTVKNYITEILSKLGLRDRTQIAIFYLKQSAQ